MNEGVIKFDLKHTFKKLDINREVEILESVRMPLFYLRLIGEKDGIGYGNVSIKVSQKSFLISGTQTGSKEFLGKSGYALVKDYDLKSFQVISLGEVKPSSESLTHAALYEILDINCVIHIHSEPLWETALKSDIAATSKDVEYGSPQMVKQIKELASTNKLNEGILVTKGHKDGLFFFSDTPSLALKNLLKFSSKLLI